MNGGADLGATITNLRGLIQAALLRDASWDEFLEAMRRLLPGGVATFFFHDAAAHRGAFSLASGMSDEALAAYAEDYCVLNPWMKAAARRPIGLAVPDSAMLARPALEQTEFFNDFMRPNGLSGAIGVTLAREGQCNFMLSVLGASSETRERRDSLHALRAIAPDLRFAFRFYRRNAGVAVPWSCAGGSSDEALATIVVGHGRRLRRASRAAQARLSEGDVVSVDLSGRLAFPDDRVGEHLDRLLGVACRGEVEPPPRAFLIAQEGRPPAKLTALLPAWDEGSRFFRGPECIVVIETPCETPLDLSEVARFFGLTEAETRVASGIAAGLTPAEFAAKVGVSLETVRSQLRSVFAKTGARRQAELARLCIALAERAG